MSIQTIFKAGNSQVVAIPKNMPFKTGQKVLVEKADEETIIIKKASSSPKKSDTEFKKWLDIFMEENGEILDELAER